MQLAVLKPPCGDQRVLLVTALAALLTHGTALTLPGLKSLGLARSSPDGAANSIGCLKEVPFEQRLDHFRRSKGQPDATYTQRVFICEKFWARNTDGSRGPIFFYAGNEGDVTLYINNTGLIWENAQDFGACIIFAEHRYYGTSQPFGPDSWRVDPTYLTVEQAMADYANLLTLYKQQQGVGPNTPLIAFGGSYGGMLAAWMRMKYPHLVQGAIAASAPLGAFAGLTGFSAAKFWEVVTYDASAAAGSVPECAANVRGAFTNIMMVGKSIIGRKALQQFLRLCDPLPDFKAVIDLGYWLQGAFDAYAMGNYPYSSSYISGDPQHPLPAWPMRAACRHMKGTHMKASVMIESLREAVGVLYNVTGDVQCYKLEGQGPAAANTGPWDYQFCSQNMAQEVPYFPSTGTTDMFWDQGPFNATAIEQHCMDAWGVKPDWQWAYATFGGLDVRYASNIVFSNGLYDPWSAYGILQDVSDSVVAVLIPEGAHHVDLMFSHPADPPSLRAARAVELQHIRKWVDEAQQAAKAAAL